MAEETRPLLLSSFVFYHLQKYPYTISLAVLHVILRLKYYFLVDYFSRTGFQKSFFFRFKQFILYLLFRLVHRRQNLSNCQKCELGQSRKQELTGRLQPKQGCQSDNLTKEIVSRQTVKSCLDKTTASDCWSSVSLSQPLSHLI